MVRNYRAVSFDEVTEFQRDLWVDAGDHHSACRVLDRGHRRPGDNYALNRNVRMSTRGEDKVTDRLNPRLNLMFLGFIADRRRVALEPLRVHLQVEEEIIK